MDQKYGHEVKDLENQKSELIRRLSAVEKLRDDAFSELTKLSKDNQKNSVLITSLTELVRSQRSIIRQAKDVIIKYEAAQDSLRDIPPFDEIFKDFDENSIENLIEGTSTEEEDTPPMEYDETDSSLSPIAHSPSVRTAQGLTSATGLRSRLPLPVFSGSGERFPKLSDHFIDEHNQMSIVPKGKQGIMAIVFNSSIKQWITGKRIPPPSHRIMEIRTQFNRIYSGKPTEDMRIQYLNRTQDASFAGREDLPSGSVYHFWYYRTHSKVCPACGTILSASGFDINVIEEHMNLKHNVLREDGPEETKIILHY